MYSKFILAINRKEEKLNKQGNTVKACVSSIKSLKMSIPQENFILFWKE
jgi:hypothetical protein